MFGLVNWILEFFLNLLKIYKIPEKWFTILQKRSFVYKCLKGYF